MIREFHLADWFTLGNAVCGTGALFSIMTFLQAQDVRHILFACGLVLAALVFDVLDGRIARWRQKSSILGRELDSLADVISFGVAPAILSFKWGLEPLGQIGWAAGFLFVSAAAVRLARFNIQAGTQDKRYFVGLPSPAAACLVAGLVWALHEYQIQGQDVKWLAWALTAFAGLTMVGNLKFYSGKDINLRKSVPFSVVVAIAFGIVALFTFSSTLPEMLFLLCVCYGVSGYAIWIYEQVRNRTAGRAPPGGL